MGLAFFFFFGPVTVVFAVIEVIQFQFRCSLHFKPILDLNAEYIYKLTLFQSLLDPGPQFFIRRGFLLLLIRAALCLFCIINDVSEL